MDVQNGASGLVCINCILFINKLSLWKLIWKMNRSLSVQLYWSLGWRGTLKSNWLFLYLFTKEMIQPCCMHWPLSLKIVTGRIRTLSKRPKTKCVELLALVLQVKFNRDSVLWGVSMTKEEKIPLRRMVDMKQHAVFMVLLSRYQVNQNKATNQCLKLKPG